MTERKVGSQFVTINGFAEAVGYSPTKVRQWIKEGLLECIHINRGLRVLPKTEIERYLNGGMMQGRDPKKA